MQDRCRVELLGTGGALAALSRVASVLAVILVPLVLVLVILLPLLSILQGGIETVFRACLLSAFYFI